MFPEAPTHGCRAPHLARRWSTPVWATISRPCASPRTGLSPLTWPPPRPAAPALRSHSRPASRLSPFASGTPTLNHVVPNSPTLGLYLSDPLWSNRQAMDSSANYFWAKTSKDGQPGISVHDHCLNVGCVAEALINLLPRPVRDLLPSGAATLAALHDVGKISTGFLRKCPVWLVQC